MDISIHWNQVYKQKGKEEQQKYIAQQERRAQQQFIYIISLIHSEMFLNVLVIENVAIGLEEPGLEERLDVEDIELLGL
jgi:hypothetical protein